MPVTRIVRPHTANPARHGPLADLLPIKALRREGEPMDFLTERFTILGVEFQYWMPIILAALALYVLYLWRTGNFN